LCTQKNLHEKLGDFTLIHKMNEDIHDIRPIGLKTYTIFFVPKGTKSEDVCTVIQNADVGIVGYVGKISDMQFGDIVSKHHTTCRTVVSTNCLTRAGEWDAYYIHSEFPFDPKSNLTAEQQLAKAEAIQQVSTFKFTIYISIAEGVEHE